MIIKHNKECSDLRFKLKGYVKRWEQAEEVTGMIYCEQCEEWSGDYCEDSEKVNRCLSCVDDDYTYCGLCGLYKLYDNQDNYIVFSEGREIEISEDSCPCCDLCGVERVVKACCVDCCKCGEQARNIAETVKTLEFIDEVCVYKFSKN